MTKKYLPALIGAILAGMTLNSALASDRDDVGSVTMDVIEHSDPHEVTHDINLPDQASDEAREHVNQQGHSDDAHEQHSSDSHDDSHDAAHEDAHEESAEAAHEDAHEDAHDSAQEQAHDDSMDSSQDPMGSSN